MTKRPITIFYSWQSWTPSTRNRQFIEDVLEQTIDQIEEAQVIIDRDTKDLPGAPAIADSILQKIEQCDIFLADVTMVVRDDEHKSPNPNVMLELGYAVRSIGWNRIIMVMNTDLGEPQALPFDLVHRRWPITYNLEKGQQKANIREQLVGALKAAIEMILNAGLPEGSDSPVELTERFIERNQTVSLDRLMRTQIQEVYERMNTQEFYDQRANLINENRTNKLDMWNKVIELYFEVCEPQLRVFMSLTYYGDEAQTKYVVHALKRWIEKEPDDPMIDTAYWRYTASLLLLYSIGIVAITNKKWAFISGAFDAEKIINPRFRDDLEQPLSLILRYFVASYWTDQQSNSANHRYPIGTFLRKLLQTSFERLIPSTSDYEHYFHVFEFLLTMCFMHLRREITGHFAPLPRDAVNGDIDARYYQEERLLDVIERWGSLGDQWELLQRGLFNGKSEEFLETITYYQTGLSKSPHGFYYDVKNYIGAYKSGLGID